MSVEIVQKFNNTLQAFKIKATCISYKRENNYFYFDIKLHPNAKVKDIQKYNDEISLMLKTTSKPRIKILHELGIVRLEFALLQNEPVKLFDLFSNEDIPNGEINCLLGQTVDGKKMWMDLATNPHLLISGTTGSGKSILLHNLIANLLNYNNTELYLIDPKRIEFSDYEKHFNKIHVYYTYNEALNLIKSALNVMEFRYDLIRYNQNVKLKPIVIIIDEFADLIMQDKEDEFYENLCRLAQKCRAAKMHLIISTQRPSVNIINGTIKANFPARIACKVASRIDSKVILDSNGAENLLGKGDALVKDNFRNLERFQVAYTSAQEICNYFGNNNAQFIGN